MAERTGISGPTRFGWRTIPAWRVDGISDEEPPAIELKENTERLDLAPYDRDKKR